MSRTISLVIAALIATVLIPIGRADASYSMICTGYSSCTSKGYSNFNYSAKQGTSYWAMYTGTNCTNYVAYRLVTTNKMPNKRPKSGVGNARDWGTTMSSITNTTPTAGSVAWWGSKVGGNHVAYVEKVVSSTEIWVSESNWSGAFDWRKITKSGSGWPQGFIHFADPAAAAPKPMAVDEAPELSSIPTVGVELTTTAGIWTPSGSGYTYAYQWFLDGAPVSGATSSTITPTAGMLGQSLSVRVTAQRSGYKTTSTTTEAVEVWPRSMTQTRAPGISGTAKVGQVLTADDGTWSPMPDEISYQWLAGTTPISGATQSTFTPTTAQVAKTISLRVTARHPDFDAQVATSAPTKNVAP